MEWKCNLVFASIRTKSDNRWRRTSMLKNSRISWRRRIKNRIILGLWIEKGNCFPIQLKTGRNNSYKVKFGRVFVTWPYESNEINPKWLNFHQLKHKWTACVCRYGKVTDRKQIKVMGRLSFQWWRFNVLINKNI